ncbi:MAG: hypothetical protein GY719_26650 [bacterium]|nr:hypothetical protein [bacterium]
MSDVVNGIRARWGVSDCGQLIGRNPDVGLASLEPEGVYEHLGVGDFWEGYTLAYKIGGADNVKYHVYGQDSGINCLSSKICRDNKREFVKKTVSRTDDDLITIRQTFIISKNATRAIIRMEISNCGRKDVDLEDFLVKRYADLDVDTGGSAGWANYQAHWDKTRYSIFSYNLDSDAPEEKRAHVVNMVAMPSDLPLDEPWIGSHGPGAFQNRNNPAPIGPLPTGRVDADGVLQWQASRFLPGEMFRINLYYDTFRSWAR